MSRKTLTNYLRTHRRKAGFSQDEIAYLLGIESGAAVSRHERGVREPNLQNTLAYSIIYGIVANELYDQRCSEICADLWARVEQLRTDLRLEMQSRRRDRKIQMLERLLAERDIQNG